MSTPLTLLVHLKNGPITSKATTQRTNFPFNSYCKFNGEFLAASTTAGLCKLGGNLDIAAQIDAYFVPIHWDFGTTDSKRMRMFYFSGTFGGKMVLTLSADEGTEHSYYFAETLTGLQRTKMKVGEGTKGVFWKMKVSNYAGCDFGMNRIDIEPTMIKYGSLNS